MKNDTNSIKLIHLLKKIIIPMDNKSFLKEET